MSVFTGQVGKAKANQENSAQNSEIEAVQRVVADRLPEEAVGQTRSILQDWRQETGTYRVVDPLLDVNNPSSCV